AFIAYLKQCNTFVPSFNNVAHAKREFDRFFSVVRRVKHLTVSKRTFIVNRNRSSFFCFLAITFLDDLVTKSAVSFLKTCSKFLHFSFRFSFSLSLSFST